MRPDSGIVLTLAALAAFGGPLALGLAGLGRRGPRAGPASTAARPWDWRLTLASALLYTLAFNLIFFVQELFLVLPKALTPGLRPTLYHNNHGWVGEHPLARLFQGTGALASVLVGLAAVAWLARRPAARSTTRRLFAVWVAFHGLFESLPQVVAGAILPQNDVGMAMDYLGFGPTAMRLAALAALVAMAAAGTWLARPLLELAGDAAQVDGRARRTRFVFRVATLPALAAILLILPFRVPGSIDQVVIVPVAVTLIGIVWVQAGAWRVTGLRLDGARAPASIRAPLVALLVVLLAFQLVLRPGIAF